MSTGPQHPGRGPVREVPRRDPRPDERGLADAGRADHGEYAAAAQDRCRGLDVGLAAEERLGVADVVRRESRPGADRTRGDTHSAGREGHVVGEDGPLERVELGTGIQAELVAQDCSAPAKRVERHLLLAAAVLRQREQRPAALAERLGEGHGLCLGQRLLVLAGTEPGVEPQLLSLKPHLVEARRLDHGDLAVGDLLVGMATPELERLAEDVDRTIVLTEPREAPRTCDGGLEPVRVDVVTRHAQAVADGSGLDDVATEGSPQPTDASVHDLRRGGGRLRAPHRVGELRGRQWTPEMEDQDGQDDAVAPGELLGHGGGHRDGTQHPDVHPVSIGTTRHGVNVYSVGGHGSAVEGLGDGPEPVGELGLRPDPELAVDVGEMELDGLRAEHDPSGDLAGRDAGCRELGHGRLL